VARATETPVSWDRIETDRGGLLAFATRAGIVRIAFLATEDADAVRNEVASRVSPRIQRAPGALDDLRAQLREHLGGRRRSLDLPVDLRLASPFAARVLAALRRVPAGRTTTYRELASQVGSPGASRAVGNACATNPVPLVVPCHRVLRSDGAIGGYRGGPDLKRHLLRLEGAIPGVDGLPRQTPVGPGGSVRLPAAS
jgi:methylated-DNA-[protein]-cysteine S-methyltransferase